VEGSGHLPGAGHAAAAHRLRRRPARGLRTGLQRAPQGLQGTAGGGHHAARNRGEATTGSTGVGLPPVSIQPVSRVLSDSRSHRGGHSSRDAIACALQQPTRSVLIGVGAPHCLFGLAPAGVYPATSVAGRAVGSYPTFSPLPALPFGSRWRCLFCGTVRRKPAFPPRRYLAACPMEPGLSSVRNPEGSATRPPGWMDVSKLT
jgi:hypothetical protein